MKAMYRAALMVAAFVFLLPLSARSEIRGGSIEVSPFVGYNWFQDKQNLKDRPVYGGRIGYNFTPHWGIEGTVEFINSSVKDQALRGPKEGQFAHPADDVDLYFYHVDGVFHFMPESRLNPFIVAGFGGAHYDPRISTLDMFAFNVGVGAKYWITDHVAIRGDLRDYMVGEITQETYHNIAATVGVTLAFGGRERAAPAQAEAIPEPVVVPPPPPPPPAAPTVAMSADPSTIEQGQCATLAWSTTGASSASIDRGIGSTDPNGSRQVCPDSTTQYTVTAMGDGGTRTASTTVTVNPPPPPPPPPPVKKAPKVIDRLVLHVNFDFDKSDVRKEDVAELQQAIDFVKKYPGYEISIEGHTDSRGSDKYNQALSERRAAAVKEYLLKHGMIDTHKDHIATRGYGESKPIANNSTEKGRFENRRVEILILEK